VSAGGGGAVPYFAGLYGRRPELAARAPGRVNLIGEHTDYNGGYVLPTPIPQQTTVELGRRRDRVVRAWSADVGGAPAEYTLGDERRGGSWIDYVAGVTQVLAAAGHELGGFDLRVSSEVPLGSGLSSSAALEVALLRALRQAFALRLDDVALALLGQRAEVELVGAPVGVMDQMASSLGEAGSALFLDTRSLAHERVPLPPELDLVVLDSGVKHSHAGGDYRLRRAECERAAALLGVRQLRDVTGAHLPRIAALPQPLGRRARHVVTENARVLEAVDALRQGDAGRLGALFRASHASLRDDFEVSVPEVDLLVELAAADPDVDGARMTGGGFGGAVVALARRGAAASAGARIAAGYCSQSGRPGQLLVPPSGRSGTALRHGG
jgi:galactokinase